MGAPPDFALPEAFWPAFFADHWDRRPLVLRAPLDMPLVTTEEIFEAITLRKRPETKLRFYVENTQVVGDDKAYLPVSEDGSMAGYARRIDQQLGHRRFGLVADDFTASHFGTWSRLRQFLRTPLTRLGLPAGGGKIHLTVFLGNYASTPFGVHVDKANVFLFVVEGAKRMRFWPAAADPTRDEALQLEANRGDVIFWPTGFQHVGEAVDGELSVTASLGLFIDGNDADTVWSAARGIVERAADLRQAFYPGEPTRPEELASQLPESVLKARDALRKVRGRELDRSLTRSWAALVTCFGFRTPPVER